MLKHSATRLAELLREDGLSSLELVEHCLDRIRRLDDELQAFVSVDEEGARRRAETCDARRRRGEPLGPLHGLPVAIKDVTATAGLRTTQGSRLLSDHVPAEDALSVARLKRAGAIVLGKTNTPEFAFGAVCTNALRGPTANPWDTRLTSGGSSGGSAVAVATGMVPLAQGTDFGGSVRTPAAFCGCVGLRPTPGVIAEPSRPLGWSTLATQGVLARGVEDAALMLAAMAGEHQDDPSSRGMAWPAPSTALERPLKVAVSVTLGDAYPVEPEVRAAFQDAVAGLEAALGPVAREHPDVGGGVEAFKTLRAAESWLTFGELVRDHADRLTPSFVWNVEQGRHTGAEAYLRAERTRTALYRRFFAFLSRFDVLALPATSVLAFPNAQEEVWEIDGQRCESIIDYLACTFLISLVGFPVVTLPASRRPGEKRFGIQLVARPGNEALLLQAALRLERQGFRHHWPPLAAPNAGES
ncbi:amidase [Billgrantia endophytica]|nr:amidase [Halomonas endophytica]